MKCIAPILALLLFLAGCMSVETKQELGVPKFAPVSPESVQILRAEPKQPCIRLGEIRVAPPSENVAASKIEEALQKAAAKWGANAVVVVADRMQIMGIQANGGCLRRISSGSRERVSEITMSQSN
jgi:hypothetical protein